MIIFFVEKNENDDDGTMQIDAYISENEEKKKKKKLECRYL